MPRYSLRLASSEDTLSLIAVLNEAFLESPYTETHSFSEDRVVKLISYVLSVGPDIGLLLLAENEGEIVGVFSALKTYTTMGLEETAIELIWWVRKDFRKTRLSIQLISAFEYWADKLGVKRLVLGSMANSHDDGIEKFYLRKGYKLTEKTYTKEVQ
jgi:GNAT superfamily N-acetyltransferase